ncbi:MAG: DUF2892 domain-containing protein [Candidatus Nanohaloarchaea archaeon]|nr:DUF2892 domain-containing protein [Candidatus Nanohaloarchaea archaeon]
MEQNLGERERRIRLLIGVVVGILAVAAYTRLGSVSLAAVLGIVALGFIANYVTCFCGTKKAVKAVMQRVRGGD